MAHGDRSVDVFVRKLRRKLEQASAGWQYIHTHFGVGYRFEPEPVVPGRRGGADPGTAPDADETPTVPSLPVHSLFTSRRHAGNKLPSGRCKPALARGLRGPRCPAPNRYRLRRRKGEFVNTGSKWLLALAATGALGLGIAACGDDDDSSGGGDLSGTISIDGSSTVQPFAEAAGELFKEENSGVDVTVGAAGTSGGFEKFCAGETDISDASRPIEPEEEKLCQEGGVEYTEVQVANDGIAIVTNPEVAISCLTVDQLAQLWEPDSKSRTTASSATTPRPASRCPTST